MATPFLIPGVHDQPVVYIFLGAPTDDLNSKSTEVLRGATCALLEKHPATLQKSLIHLAMAWCDGLAALRD
ncbi:hypothetical protein Pmar_PMAR011237 [Perkinsus marinus ATCC 50983]|uniref:Uncharacterized protein n=1 Tax=Perkinsus marinus (strain ATCC 50983 / TXsc) TaxID=423536 RepID=C5LTM3_PERM5|nr:hypothetical protein Pmar_PMAR011237 [Perkinsus marinus ATCC 50983]EEQ99919.1 hypothetical protein Pmar_PMAR011237 [Perkinsus marinus ATCC 50983]|eukprot:XP_002767202.1 hypothetical protein Pmar_PMAR011237 [Perkinsus marinus ATCC 50983]